MSFRLRLVLAAAYLLAAVVIALEIPLALNVDRRAASEFQSGVLGNAAVLAARSADLVAGANRAAGPSARTLTRLRALAAETSDTGVQRVVITDVRGEVLADTEGLAETGTPYATAERPEFGAALFEGRIDFRRRPSESLGEELLLVTVPVVDAERVVGAVRVSAPTAAVEADVRRSWLRLGLIGLLVVGGGLGLAWLLAGTVARPLERLRRTAGSLGQGDLDARASAEGPAELRAVARSFNDMAAALGANLAAQSDFLANASHQLRTPLTGLRLRLEALEEEGGTVAVQAGKATAELDRLSALVEDLLELARASSADVTGREVDLADAADQALRRWTAPAEAAGKQVRLAGSGPVPAWANGGDLAHVLDNLIENALRYTPAGTTVTVEARAEGGRAVLAVADDGPGIPVGERERLFERFYRGARGKESGPGTGLGLAIVAELAARWDGDVRLLEGPGTRFEASFPAPPTVS